MKCLWLGGENFDVSPKTEYVQTGFRHENDPTLLVWHKTSNTDLLTHDLTSILYIPVTIVMAITHSVM